MNVFSCHPRAHAAIRYTVVIPAIILFGACGCSKPPDLPLLWERVPLTGVPPDLDTEVYVDVGAVGDKIAIVKQYSPGLLVFTEGKWATTRPLPTPYKGGMSILLKGSQYAAIAGRDGVWLHYENGQWHAETVPLCRPVLAYCNLNRQVIFRDELIVSPVFKNALFVRGEEGWREMPLAFDQDVWAGPLWVGDGRLVAGMTIGRSGKGSFLASYDGEKWTTLKFDKGRAWIHGIAGPHANDLWIVGREGTLFGKKALIAHSDGVTLKRYPNSFPQLEDVVVISHNEAYAVGLKGAIIRWDGTSWQAVASPVRSSLFKLALAGTGDILAVGDKATLLRLPQAKRVLVSHP